GVKEDKIECGKLFMEPTECVEDRRSHQPEARLDPKRGEIFADKLDGGTVVFNEDHFARPATQRFQAYRARARIGVQETRARHLGAEHVEQRLTQLIRGRPKIRVLQSAKRQSAVCAGNDAQSRASLVRSPWSLATDY